MTLAPVDLLVGVIAARALAAGTFTDLAVDHAGGRARHPADPLAVDHQRHVTDRFEQKAAHEAAEPPIDRLPRREVLRQHPPAAARPRYVADRIQEAAHPWRTHRQGRLAARELDPLDLCKGASLGSRRERGAKAQAIGPSRGGQTTNIHLVTDLLGRPVTLHLTPGNVSDVTAAPELLDQRPLKTVIADKGYNADQSLSVLR
jgi:Transposase DDE domain